MSSVLQLGDVSKSTTKNINVPQHVSDPNHGETLVEVRDWFKHISLLNLKLTYKTFIHKKQFIGLERKLKAYMVPFPVRDWKPYLEKPFKKLPNITKYQHFRFSLEQPGSVFVRELPSSPEKKISLLRQPVN